MDLADLFILCLVPRYMSCMTCFCSCRICSNLYQQLISRTLSHGTMFVNQLTGNEIVLSGFVQVLFDQMCVHNGAFTSSANISFWCTYVCFLIKISNLEILGFLVRHGFC